MSGEEKLLLGLTNRGHPKLSLDGYDYRKGVPRANGDVTWRCLNKSCKAQVITDKQMKNVVLKPNSPLGVDHCHPPNTPMLDANDSTTVNLASSTPSNVCRERSSNCDSLTDGERNESLPAVSVNLNGKSCGCFSMIEKLIIEKNNLIVDNQRLRDQWNAAIDRSIVNDLRIMELTNRPMRDGSSQTVTTTHVEEREGSKSVSSETDERHLSVKDRMTEDCNKFPLGMSLEQLYLLVEENTSLMDQIILLGDELERVKRAVVHMEGLKRVFEPLGAKEHTNIRIWSDSHGRGLNRMLSKMLPTGVRCVSHVAPGAPLEVLMDGMLSKREIDSTKPDDFVVLVGGSNSFDSDVFSQDCIDGFIVKLMRVVNSYRHANLILTTIPYRYDLKESSMANVSIKRVNRVIRNIPASCPDSSISVVSLWTYYRSLHTAHGLHLNKRGKLKLVEEVFGVINGFLSTRTVSAGSQLEPQICLSGPDCLDHPVLLDKSLSLVCEETSIVGSGDFLETSTLCLGMI
ncbi:hypothetical protein LSTR_LSTR016153 [Laodelphax striatellus]|uniref:FLYWCH-type domain-containing protein n=1 Tax=Laodelphax striatellus TaxID=195883 RepID=A0A482WVV1_LAOST|nr:hypothetical protein LSTR_LSTR012758 [Laodelphax striatellus]RZF37625.1 hypothetical protein LSTR_LSTR016153 [Laodelphax striatellus]